MRRLLCDTIKLARPELLFREGRYQELYVCMSAVLISSSIKLSSGSAVNSRTWRRIGILSEIETEYFQKRRRESAGKEKCRGKYEEWSPEAVAVEEKGCCRGADGCSFLFPGYPPGYFLTYLAGTMATMV